MKMAMKMTPLKKALYDAVQKSIHTDQKIILYIPHIDVENLDQIKNYVIEFGASDVKIEDGEFFHNVSGLLNDGYFTVDLDIP